MDLEDKLVWTVLTVIIGFLSFWGFQYLHNSLNAWVAKKHTETAKKYSWLFTDHSHKYVLVFMLLKIGVVICLLWLQIVTMPELIK